jgi:hypothetical protein
MLAVIGLLYSFGQVLGQRRTLQTAADAASLGGAWQVLRELASDNRADSQVLSTVQTFATNNGATSTSAVYLDASGVQLASVGTFGAGAFPFTARGVRVTVQNQVPTILPGFVTISQLAVNATASATARPTLSPATASLVLPIAINVSDAASAYVGHTQYDLFAHPLAGGQAPTLNLAASGAPTFSTSSNEARIQYWSDGQSSGAWQLSQPTTATLADGAYYDSIAAGLHDNVRRQGLVDSNLQAYALVTVSVYDSSTSTTVHIAGFVQMKLRNADISTTQARGWVVAYPTAAAGTPVVPTTDLGAALIGLVQ